jgi:FMN phosphatase YigB (HAD superfamily)
MHTNVPWPFADRLPVAVFFDLDDTLMDTAGQIVDLAVTDATDALIEAGLRADRADLLAFLRSRTEAAEGGNHWDAALDRFGLVNQDADPEAVVRAGRDAFFSTDLPELEPLPGCRRLLSRLRDAGCLLFLVTGGKPSTQREKIQRLCFTDVFDAIAFADSLAGESKLPAFEDLVERFSLRPVECLCVGDRVVGEIHDGNQLGMYTVRMRGGEFAAMEPSSPVEIPDLEITSLYELATVMGLHLEGPPVASSPE